KKVKGYSEGNTDSSLIGTQQNEHKYQYLKNEKKINEDKALRLSESLFEVTNDGEFNITQSGDGSNVPFYTVSYSDDDKNAHMDLRQQCWHALSLQVDSHVW